MVIVYQHICIGIFLLTPLHLQIIDCSAPFVVGIRTNEQFVDDSGEAADFEENLSLGICLEYSQEPC